MSSSVEVGRYGRIVLPKEVREQYGVEEGSQLIIRRRQGEIVLIPVKSYERPTEALYGSIETEAPMDEPKRIAREHIRKRMAEDLG